MEFMDMAKVFDVDSSMLSRTRAFLNKRKDGKGAACDSLVYSLVRVAIA